MAFENIELRRLQDDEREAFIKMNQLAFRIGAVDEFGPQDEEIISREDILHLNAGYEIMGRCGMYGHEYYACEKILAVSA